MAPGLRAGNMPLERWATAVAALALGLVCVFIVLTVVSRWLGRVLIPDDVQVVRQMMIAVIILPLASVTALRMHIAVTVFTDRLSARKLGAVTPLRQRDRLSWWSPSCSGAV